MRVGTGFDAHRFARGRPLVLGGLSIPYPSGLKGWSDGDVVIHALADALLGAVSEGDIGKHFPPGDPEYKDVSSLTILGRVTELLKAKGCRVLNADVVVILEKPRLERYRDAMRKTLAEAMGVRTDQVSVKASTTERLGFTGREEGVAAHAVVLVAEGRVTSDE